MKKYLFVNILKSYSLRRVWVGVLISFFVVSGASALTGTIISTATAQALVCHDATCTPALAGKINFKPTITSGITPISIDDSLGISGNAWGNEIGWINMKTTSQGVTMNLETGSTTGYAWSSACGWINFSPTGFGVRIETETAETAVGNGVGKFYGYAWCGGERGGWINFDCAVAGNVACVKTNWVKSGDRFVAAVTPAPSGGGGGSVVSTTTSINNTYLNQTGKQNQKIDFSNDYRADINDSGKIDILDFNMLIVNWAKRQSVDLKLTKKDRCQQVNLADVNCDGFVNVLDFNLVLVYWGQYIGN